MFFFADASPGQIDIIGSNSLAAAHQPASAYWRSLGHRVLKLDGLTVTFHSSSSPNPRPVQPPPVIEPPAISVDLLEDGVDEGGKWFQKLRVTIKPGGTLAEVSEAIYGDVLHVDQLLDLARQQNPHVQRPQNLRVGDLIEIRVDPSATHVVKETEWDEAEGKLTNIFFNGGREITYPNQKDGTLRILDFPNDGRTRGFTFNMDDQVITMMPGFRFAEYAYRSGDSFQDVVRRIYGGVTASALQDFIVQTKWTPDRWPPPSSEKRRLVISVVKAWEDVRPASTGFPEEQVVRNDSYRALMKKRSDVGVFPLAREGVGTQYRAEITDPMILAKDLSKLLYGTEDRYLQLAALAGIGPGTSATAPEGFNPPLLGQRFDVYVDYVEEWFILEGPIYDRQSQRTVTKLSNGTVIEEYDPAFSHKEGMQRAIYYPTGYKKLVYQPNEIAYAGLDFLYFVLSGMSADLNSDEDKKKAQDFIANFFWTWAPGLPREQGDKTESFTVFETPDWKTVEIVIGPKTSSDLIPLLFYDLWMGNPCLAAIAVVFLATVAVFAVGMVLRRRR